MTAPETPVAGGTLPPASHRCTTPAADRPTSWRPVGQRSLLIEAVAYGALALIVAITLVAAFWPHK